MGGEKPTGRGRNHPSGNSFSILQDEGTHRSGSGPETEDSDPRSSKNILDHTATSSLVAEKITVKQSPAPAAASSTEAALVTGANMMGGSGKGKQKPAKKLQTQNDTESVTMGVTERILKQITDIYETGPGGGRSRSTWFLQVPV